MKQPASRCSVHRAPDAAGAPVAGFAVNFTAMPLTAMPLTALPLTALPTPGWPTPGCALHTKRAFGKRLGSYGIPATGTRRPKEPST